MMLDKHYLYHRFLQHNHDIIYFYSIKINHFYKITGIPAVLNTSLNLHGDPISSSLEDVINTFKVSGLKYLYLEDQYLIEKK